MSRLREIGFFARVCAFTTTTAFAAGMFVGSSGFRGFEGNQPIGFQPYIYSTTDNGVPVIGCDAIPISITPEELNNNIKEIILKIGNETYVRKNVSTLRTPDSTLFGKAQSPYISCSITDQIGNNKTEVRIR